MKIAYNPSGASPLAGAPENNNDIIFDLAGKAIYVKDVKLLGTDIFKKHTSSSGGGNVGLVPVPSYTNTNTRFLREDGTWVIPTDNKVLLGVSSNSKFRCLLLGSAQYESLPSAPSEVTGLAYITKNIYVDPSKATLYADTFVGKLAYTNLTGSTTTANLAIVSTGVANGWTLKTLGSNAFDSTKYLPLTGGTLSGDLNFSHLSNSVKGYITWTKGTVLQRIQISDNGSTNDAVFTFLLSTNSGTDWTDLFTIKDNGYAVATTFQGNLDGTYVNKLTGYSKATAAADLATTDTLNAALGKLEYKADVAYDLVKGAYDGDGTIKNLTEILKVLEGIKDTETIKAIVGKYLPLAGGTMNSTAYIAWNSGDNGNDVTDWNITDTGLRIISSVTETSNAPMKYSTALHVKGRYGFQIASQGGGTANSFFIKNVHNTVWNTLLHSNNYSLYLDNRYYTETEADARFVNVSGDTMNSGAILTFPRTSYIVLTSDATSNYVSPIKWYKGTSASATGTYDAQIGWHNTGDTDGAIVLLPHPTTSDPWNTTVGLFIGKNTLKWENNILLHSSNYTSYTVKKDGTGATGTWGISITGSSKSINVGTASGDVDYPMLFTTSTSAASNAALYIDADKKVTFNPSTNTLKVGGIVAATADFSGDITLNLTNADRFINLNYTNTGYDWRIGNLGSGSEDANYFVIQSDKTGTTYYDALKIGCTSLKTWLGGELNVNGLAKATNFKSTIATGTQPYICTSTTLNTNLNADLLDGKHASGFSYNMVSDDYDCNALPNGTHSATYRLNANPTNAFPNAAYGNLLVIGSGSDTMTQIGAPYDIDALYFRRGTWKSDGSGTIKDNEWITILHNGNSSVSGGGSTWESSITINIGGISKTLTIPSNPNTDLNIKQGVSSTSKFRCLLLGTTLYDSAPTSPTEVTGQAYIAKNIYVNPSNATLYAATFSGALSGNATSATKLATARTLWGQSFDGTANVSGSLSAVENIAMSGRLRVNTSIADHSNPTYLCIVINCGTPPEGTTITNKNAPGIGFHIANRSWASLIYTGTFRFINSDATAYSDVAANKFIKANSSDSYVLLGGGGHKALSDFVVADGGTSTNSDYLTIHDVRGTDHLPNSTTYPLKHLTSWFNNTGTPSSSWHSGITVKGWTNDYATWLLCSVSTSGVGTSHNLYFRHGISNTWGNWKTILDSSNSSVSKLDETLSVTINGTTQTLTNTWRSITDSYSGTSTSISLSLKGANALYNALVDGNAATLEGYSSDKFVKKDGGYPISTTGTTPYAYVHLFRIAVSSTWSNKSVDFIVRTRNYKFDFYVNIDTGAIQYGYDLSANLYNTIKIYKETKTARSGQLYYLTTEQTSGYNYFDIYLKISSWLGGYYDIINIGGTGTLIFEDKRIYLDSLPSGCIEVTETLLPNSDKLDGYHASSFALASQIPSVGNGTITITLGGTYKGSFKMNLSDNATIELSDSNTTYSFSNNAPTLSWGTTSTIGTVGGVALTVTMPDNPNTNTTYSAGTGLSLSGTTFNHNNSVTAKTSYGSTSTTASAAGGIIKVTDVKYDSCGHITASVDRSITLSLDHIKTSITEGTAGTSSATSGSTLEMPYVTVNANGHVTGYGTHTHTITGFASSSDLANYLPLSGGTMNVGAVINIIYKDANNYGGLVFKGSTSDSNVAHLYKNVTNSKTLTLDGSFTISGNLSIVGNESWSNLITIVRNDNGTLYSTNSSLNPLTSIKHAIDFLWYETHWLIGNVRAGDRTSQGFGITHSNNDLRFLISTTAAYTYGNFIVSGSLSAENGNFYTNSSGAYWSSDRRLKNNISIARNLNIDSLIKEFDWKDTGKHSWGFIALELLEVLPEAVNYNKDTDRYSVNYDVAHSAAIASLNAKIKLLELRIKELEDGKTSNE